MKFEKPPLIELVAEFRWHPTDGNGKLVTNPNYVGVSSPETELFYDSFRQIMAEQGFNASERLVPNGFPHAMFQPVVRFRRTDSPASSAVLQVGIGLLSVHALPPYEDWESFKPIIETALAALIETRRRTVDARLAEVPGVPIPTDNREFFAISLRYINSFGPTMRRELPIRSFFEQVFKLKVDLPQSFSDLAKDPGEIGLTLLAKTPLKEGGRLQLSLGQNPNDPQSVVMDTVVFCENSVLWVGNGPMETLEKAHGAIRHLFVGMTAPIYDLMQPADDEARKL